MSAADAFIDTNVLLYLLSNDMQKADIAEAVLSHGGVLSVQILNEFVSVAKRKLGLSIAEIRDILDSIRRVCRVDPLTLATHDRALDIAERTGYAIYDSLVIAAALLSGCSILYSEDMQHGQVIDSTLTIRNPFST